ncbi:tripartite tricarboxylate transporter substrate binding protein [Bradyrhizobium prioriisuperbiae]|uniref:Bug family tripartite tricarboxylate transporter substrate binding protein n=1 Tax=Bradyrhizobium prioriisuperbiae TaxID=2854389 RepID=UPI0028E93D14|nr:tripartite tricarboxylate transporter substrate binding protein [Bradyrhizobium prioritasuperba]
MKKLLAVLLALTVTGGLAHAQSWPSRNVRVIVPFAPGSTPDSVGRIVAERFQAKFGTPFVVENKPGASGNTGTDAVAKAETDGTTIGLSIVGPLVLNKLLFQSLPYDPATDLAPITIVASQPSILVVSNNLGVKTFADFAALLKRDAAKLNFGSIGYGSLSHLAMAAIAMKSNAHPEHIPYAGSPNVVTALTRNDVQMAVLPAAAVVEQAKAGMLTMLAVTSPKRSALLPELPTLRENGIEGVEADAWIGLIAPAKLSPAIQDKIRDTVAEIAADPAIREKLALLYMEPVANSTEAFRAVMKEELDRWEPVIRTNNIRISQ